MLPPSLMIFFTFESTIPCTIPVAPICVRTLPCTFPAASITYHLCCPILASVYSIFWPDGAHALEKTQMLIMSPCFICKEQATSNIIITVRWSSSQAVQGYPIRPIRPSFRFDCSKLLWSLQYWSNTPNLDFTSSVHHLLIICSSSARHQFIIS